MSITSRASNGSETARDAIHEAGERLEESTRGARKAAAETLDSAATYGRKHAEEAYDAAQNMARATGRYVRENPMQAALIGLGGLFLASLLFRRR